MIDQLCIHYYVIGKVQGVWFRTSTKTQADQLGLTGWVRNLSDGRVEVLACGTKHNIKQFHEWLKHGPDLATVSQLIDEDLPYKDYGGFNII